MAPLLLKSVIWDLDGVLLDSEPLYMSAECTVAAAHGADVRPYLGHVLGLPGIRAAELYVRELKLPITASEFLTARNAQLTTAFRHITTCRGAMDAVRHIRAQGLKCAIGTSSSASLLTIKRLAQPELFSLMDAVVCADDVTEAKPSPMVFLKAARQIGTKASECLVFEDAPAGVQAAKAAGMHCVALRNPHVKHEIYASAGADFVVDSGCLLDFDFSQIGMEPMA